MTLQSYATTQAIVAYPPENGKRQWRLEDVELTQPEDDEAIVEVIATGICHTDLGCASAPDGTPGFPVPPYPRIVGHEGAGYVSEDELKMLAPLGCGIQTGAGTITKLAAATQDDTVAVIGLGGVGLAAVMAAKIIGCRTVIGIDRVPSRLDLAQSLGATHTVNTANITNTLTEGIRKLTGGPGSTITVDATGVVPLIKQGLEFTANQGKMILLGVAPMDASLDLPIVPHMVSGKQLLGSMEGGVYPEDYIPQLIQWYHEGRFPLGKLIKTYDVKDFELAVKDMEDGTTIKPILIWS
ncbi:hypothetical protein CGMCC3_g8673 [Colletotrichum fructicola]|nr:uncharacterized protein CGMCC3_g8673 [Colletotrichum fructicola]KAE9575234.1 hypothetical protein CGMCC3_g8673 [Colletotrichum fructicola]